MQNAIRTILGTAFIVAASVAVAGPVAGQGTWEATLQARDLDRDGVVDAYYDTTLNISWLASANVAGPLDFNSAVAWATGLDVAGVTGWHLPTIHIDSCAEGYGPTFWNGGGTCGYNVQAATSDMASMNLVTLGNPSYSGFTDTYGNGPGVSGNLLENSGPFNNLEALGYWFSRDYSIDPYTGLPSASEAWRYSFHAGRQDSLDKSATLFAWAVHDGDVGQTVAAIPEPQTYALMLVGLAVLAPLARRRRQRAAAITHAHCAN